MRTLGWLALLGALVVPISPPTAHAAPLVATGSELARTMPDVLDVAVRCGRGAHYVRGYRARDGRWVKGRCVRDRRRR